MSIMKIENLQAKIGDKQILKGLNLELEPGKVHAIMGPNGAGKSTTMRIITCYQAATHGDVVLDGVSVRDSLGR